MSEIDKAIEKAWHNIQSKPLKIVPSPKVEEGKKEKKKKPTPYKAMLGAYRSPKTPPSIKKGLEKKLKEKGLI